MISSVRSSLIIFLLLFFISPYSFFLFFLPSLCSSFSFVISSNRFLLSFFPHSFFFFSTRQFPSFPSISQSLFPLSSLRPFSLIIFSSFYLFLYFFALLPPSTFSIFSLCYLFPPVIILQFFLFPKFHLSFILLLSRSIHFNSYNLSSIHCYLSPFFLPLFLLFIPPTPSLSSFPPLQSLSLLSSLPFSLSPSTYSFSPFFLPPTLPSSSSPPCPSLPLPAPPRPEP